MASPITNAAPAVINGNMVPAGDDPALHKPAPTIEVDHAAAMAAIIAKEVYTDEDVKAIAAHQRERRRQQAARDLAAKLKAQNKKTPKKKAAKDGPQEEETGNA